MPPPPAPSNRANRTLAFALCGLSKFVLGRLHQSLELHVARELLPFLLFLVNPSDVPREILDPHLDLRHSCHLEDARCVVELDVLETPFVEQTLEVQKETEAGPLLDQEVLVHVLPSVREAI